MGVGAQSKSLVEADRSHDDVVGCRPVGVWEHGCAGLDGNEGRGGGGAPINSGVGGSGYFLLQVFFPKQLPQRRVGRGWVGGGVSRTPSPLRLGEGVVGDTSYLLPLFGGVPIQPCGCGH